MQPQIFNRKKTGDQIRDQGSSILTKSFSTAFSSILSNVVLERGRAGKMILSKLESDRVNKILQENNEICKSSEIGQL